MNKFRITLLNTETNKTLSAYSFNSRKEANNAIPAICKHHELKKAGRDFVNYQTSKELQILF